MTSCLRSQDFLEKIRNTLLSDKLTIVENYALNPQSKIKHGGRRQQRGGVPGALKDGAVFCNSSSPVQSDDQKTHQVVKLLRDWLGNKLTKDDSKDDDQLVSYCIAYNILSRAMPRLLSSARPAEKGVVENVILQNSPYKFKLKTYTVPLSGEGDDKPALNTRQTDLSGLKLINAIPGILANQRVTELRIRYGDYRLVLFSNPFQGKIMWEVAFYNKVYPELVHQDDDVEVELYDLYVESDEGKYQGFMILKEFVELFYKGLNDTLQYRPGALQASLANLSLEDKRGGRKQSKHTKSMKKS